MTVFAPTGRGKMMLIDKNFIAKKTTILKILSKTHVMYLKRQPRTCRIQIQVEKV